MLQLMTIASYALTEDSKAIISCSLYSPIKHYKHHQYLPFPY